MQERQVTIGRETRSVPEPFLVMATQNPIETEGTYPLPEAQLDRFMLKVLVGYPTPTEEFVIVERMTGAWRSDPAGHRHHQLIGCSGWPTPSTSTLRSSSTSCASSARPAIRPRWASADLARYVTYGASPRASINMILAAKALAFVRGRHYALPQDVATWPSTSSATARAVVRGALRRRHRRRVLDTMLGTSPSPRSLSMSAAPDARLDAPSRSHA